MQTTYPQVKDLLKKAQEVIDKHTTRVKVHIDDHSLWRLDEYVLDELKHNSILKKEDWPSYTSNAPRTLSRVVSSMLNRNPIKYKWVLPEDVGEKEEDTISKNEHLINGAIYEADQVRTRRGDNDLQWTITWYIIHRGGVVFCPLFVPEDPDNMWKIKVYDPIESAWDKGTDCIDFFVHKYYESKEAVETEWGVEINAGDIAQVEVWDLWWIDTDEEDVYEVNAETNELEKAYTKRRKHTVFNAVVCGKEWLKEPTAHKEFSHTPVYVVRAGGNPSSTNIYGGIESSAIAEQWEGLYSGVRQTIGWLNRAMTLYGLYLRNGAIGPYIYKGKLAKNIEMALKPFKVIKIGEKEEFGPTSLPTMANEAKEFLNYVKGEWQKAGVADIVFGDVPFTVSGFGMIQLRGAVEVLISSFIKATERTYQLIADELTQQFIKMGRNRKIDVRGTDSRSKEFLDVISAKDIQKKYIIKASLNEGLPKDPGQLGNAAQLWKQAGVPTHKIFEDVFEFDNAAEMSREGLRERAENLPPVMVARMIKALMLAGDFETAALVTEFASSQGLTNNPNAGPGPQNQNPAQKGSNPAFAPPELAGIGEQATGGNPQGGGA